jgi:hypothetical protein
MTATDDLTNRWPLHGDPPRSAPPPQCSAPTMLARSSVLGSQGEYVMTAVARMLDAVAKKIHEQVDVGYEVVSTATEIAEHVLACVRTGGAQR